jgi:hypothetical protein
MTLRRMTVMIFNACALWFGLSWAFVFGSMLVANEHSITLWDGNVAILSLEFAIATGVTVWAAVRLRRRDNA